jgi:hypothetical protein
VRIFDQLCIAVQSEVTAEVDADVELFLIGSCKIY